MKKITVRYSLFFFSIIIIAVLIWLAGAYFLFYSGLKRSFYPYVNAIQLEISDSNVTSLADLSQERIDEIFKDLDESKQVLTYALSGGNGNRRYYEVKKRDDVSFWGLNASYPVKLNGETAGYLTIWPSYRHVMGFLFSEKNILFLVLLFLFLLAGTVLIFGFTVYYKFASPFEKIKNSVRNIADGKAYNVGGENGQWKETGAALNKIDSKIADLKSNLDALFYVSKALTSQFDIDRVFSAILEMICGKAPNLMAAIFLPSESGGLTIASKCGYPQKFKKSFSMDESNPVTDAFASGKVTTVKNLNLYGKDFSKEFIKAGALTQIDVPITDEDGNSAGVLSVSAFSSEGFDENIAGAVETAAQYLSMALRNLKIYEKIYDDNRKLESEVNITSNELIQTNARLIRKVRDLKALSDISEFASARFDLEEIAGFIIKEISRLVSAETAGFLMEDEKSGKFDFVGGSFSLDSSALAAAAAAYKNSAIAKEIKEKKQPLVFAGADELELKAPELSRAIRLSSAAIIPVLKNDKAIGVMICANKFGSEFSSSDIDILERIASLFAGICEKADIFVALERKIIELSSKK